MHAWIGTSSFFCWRTNIFLILFILISDPASILDVDFFPVNTAYSHRFLFYLKHMFLGEHRAMYENFMVVFTKKTME